MRLVINLIFVAIAIFLAYMLVGSISEPVQFEAEKNKRETAVVDQLKKIRKAQDYYRSITGEFAGSWDTLNYVLQNDSFKITKVEGDPDDPTGAGVIYTEIFRSAKDSLAVVGFDISGLSTIPFTDNMKFDIWADTTTYQSTLVQVVEVGTKRSNYMGKYADPKFKKYDSAYNPTGTIKFGNRITPNTSGNWE